MIRQNATCSCRQILAGSKIPQKHFDKKADVYKVFSFVKQYDVKIIVYFNNFLQFDLFLT